MGRDQSAACHVTLPRPDRPKTKNPGKPGETSDHVPRNSASGRAVTMPDWHRMMVVVAPRELATAPTFAHYRGQFGLVPRDFANIAVMLASCRGQSVAGASQFRGTGTPEPDLPVKPRRSLKCGTYAAMRRLSKFNTYAGETGLLRAVKARRSGLRPLRPGDC